MIDLSGLRAELASLIERFKTDAHALLAKIEGQGADDVRTVETDAQQAEQAVTDQLPTQQ